MVLVMSEEQLKAAVTEATAQVEDGVEEISEEDLAGVDGGGSRGVTPTYYPVTIGEASNRM